MQPSHWLGLLLLAFAFSSTSCVQHKELINFNDANLPENSPEAIVNSVNLTIQPEDLLRIDVTSIDETAAAPFNLDHGMTRMGGNQNMQQGQGGSNNLELFMGYFVDQDGFIDFPVLGRIEVKGLTLEEAKKKIYDQLDPFLRDPVVNMRYLNFKVTVMGEVNLPGTIRLTNKRVTVLEALGMAGDLTDYANRKNVLVIREEEGKRSFARLDLQKEKIFSSPYFYLQQNDVIYVEPIQVKIATVADPAQRILGYSSAGLSLIALIITLSK
jgi:polysaccharide export outer membrane protein